jgi:nitrogen fixation/metabolism regulation signal transduction histidine kinase
MAQLRDQYRDARELVELSKARDLRRGFTTTLIILVASVWLVSFVWLIYLANRMSQPIQQLTSGLSDLASGNLQTRIDIKRNDELGRAIGAFNDTAAELEQSRDRLVYLTQVASWQALARKMAHELKNSLTPIRLTVEEILARQPAGDRQFMAQAVQIVVNEVETLERRVRAFSDFSSEPTAHLTVVDINSLFEERVSFLKPGHPDVSYSLDLEMALPSAKADSDHVKGILTNLLENAAEAAGAGGRVLCRTYASNGDLHVEVHDSGPGLSDEASKTVFEPTITFKKGGMGLGLSIARKNALLCGGDLMLVEGELGGAGFRVVLPRS